MGRPKKTIPVDYDELVASISQGNLDNRTTVAKAIRDTRKALADNPAESIKAILRNNLATLVMIQTELIKESQGKPIIVNGRLDKRLAKDLLAIQKQIMQQCNILALVEGINKTRWEQKGNIKTNGNEELANIILDME